MKYLTIISGQMHLLHQFKSDFAHLLALDHLVIELPNAKKCAKSLLNWWRRWNCPEIMVRYFIQTVYY